MKKLLTMCVMLTGVFTLLVGTTSCNKNDEECCEWTDDDGDSYKFCEEDGIVENYEWSYFQATAASYGGECD